MATERRAPRCREEAALVAWVQGELAAPEAARLARHVEGCEGCRAFAEDARRVIAALEDAPPDRVGLAAPRRRPRSRAVAAAAAAGVVLTIAFALGPRSRGPADDVAADPAAWLAATLGPDGTWDPALWEGLQAHPVGVHALALRALVHGGADREAIDRASTWLLGRQAPDGSLGRPLDEGPFDHAVATTALLEAWGATGRGDVRAAADRALVHLLGGTAPGAGDAASEQGESAPGGGAAPPGRLPRVTRDNAAHTAWMLRAVMRADELGWPGLAAAIADGRRRLSLETGRLLPAAELRPVDVERVALEPRPPPVVASMGALLAASEDVLVRSRR